MSEKITFKDLTNTISESSGYSQRSTVKFIRDLTDVIEAGLRQDGDASIGGFGKFELKQMKARKGVNPTTGEEILVPEQNKVVFKPFKQLRDLVNEAYAHMEPQILDEEPESTVEPRIPDEGPESTVEPRIPDEGPESTVEPRTPDEEPASSEENRSETTPKTPTPSGSDVPSADSSDADDESIDDLVYERPSPLNSRI